MMLPTDEPEIILDLSRLLSRILHPTPTGVDRCEMAYARELLRTCPDRVRFAAVHPSGFFGRLPTAAVTRFLDATEERWEHRGFTSIWDRRRFATAALAALRPRLPTPSRQARTFYLQASPNNLTHPTRMAKILQRENARFVCLVHDLIPLQYPEYARPGGAVEHGRRIATIGRLADGIVVNSHATLAALEGQLVSTGRQPLTAVAHLGISIQATKSGLAAGRPYFVCIGTIEPRKNHLLLLNLWRRMAEERGSDVIPKLLIVGRRGWENEQIVDMLERCPALVGCVEELNALPDREMQQLLGASRGLLLPSFAEGYGMPVSEALSLGVPVVCSDLPALREAGGAVPFFLDPLDGPGWAKAIDDLTLDDSGLRAAQRLRLAAWRPSAWSEHIAIVLDMLHRLGA